MRRCLLLLALAGCDLYFHDVPPDGRPPVDCPSYVWCDDGTLYRSPALDDQPFCTFGTSSGMPFGLCESGCATEAERVCDDEDPCTLADAEGLCLVRPPAATCTLGGQPCRDEGAIEPCTDSLACGRSVEVGECACSAGAWSCQSACADGLCSADEVLAAMVGRWRGTVDPPFFAEPYTMTLEVLPDGHYVPDCPGGDCSGFYYGLDGPHANRRLWVVAQTELGASLEIDIVFSEDGQTATSPGLITGLRVDADTMTFGFIAAWTDGCLGPFEFVLQRVP